MTDIKRTRDRSAASTGMGAPSDGMDMANVSMLIRQMQENIEDLSRRIPAIPEPVEETPVDQSIRIDIDLNKLEIGDVLNSLDRLREEFRRVLHVKVWEVDAESDLPEGNFISVRDLGYTTDDTTWWQRNAANNGWKLLEHDLSDVTPEDIATVGDAGTNLDGSRSNHVHAGVIASDLPGPPDTAALALVGTTRTTGSSGRYARQDHQHGVNGSAGGAPDDSLYFSSNKAGVKLNSVGIIFSHLT